MSDEKKAGPSRADRLKQLRQEHAASVERALAVFREQKQMQQTVCQFIRDNPKTVPEIAAQIGKPTQDVLWFVTSLKKYGIVEEAGMCGDYPLYKRAKGAEA